MAVLCQHHSDLLQLTGLLGQANQPVSIHALWASTTKGFRACKCQQPSPGETSPLHPLLAHSLPALPSPCLPLPPPCFPPPQYCLHGPHSSLPACSCQVSATLLGEPDLGLLSTSDMVQQTSHICSTIPELPIVVDADTGGGSVLSVQHVIRRLIAAGAWPVHSPASPWPSQCFAVSSSLPACNCHSAALAALVHPASRPGNQMSLLLWQASYTVPLRP